MVFLGGSLLNAVSWITLLLAGLDLSSAWGTDPCTHDPHIQEVLTLFLKERARKRPFPIHSDLVLGLGRASVPCLLPLLDSPDVFIAPEIARILGELRDPRALNALAVSMKKVEKNLNNGTRQAGQQALLKFGPAAVSVYLDFAKSDDTILKSFADEGLRQIQKEYFPAAYSDTAPGTERIRWFERRQGPAR